MKKVTMCLVCIMLVFTMITLSYADSEIINGSDYKIGDTSTKPDVEKNVEVINTAPVVDFSTKPKQKVDVFFNIGNSGQNNINTITSKVNSILKTQLAANNIDLNFTMNQGQYTKIAKIVPQNDKYYLLQADGTVWVWGYNVSILDCNKAYNEPFGGGNIYYTGINVNTPIKIAGLTNVVDIAPGKYSLTVLKSDGYVYSMGYSNNTYFPATLGLGSDVQYCNMTKVSGLSNITAISGYGTHILALSKSGTVYAWGENVFGELGNSSLHSLDGTALYGAPQDNYATPQSVEGLTNVSYIYAGEAVSFAQQKDGTLWAWGNNENGQLGDGTVISRNKPVKVLGINNISEIASVGGITLALTSSGNVYSWGKNGWGRVGDGTSSGNVTIPKQILSSCISISSNVDQSLAVSTDGSVWGWGSNNYNRVGLNTGSLLTPSKLQKLTGIGKVVASNEGSVAISKDGNMYVWGRDASITSTDYYYDGSIVQGQYGGSPNPIPLYSTDGIKNVVYGDGFMAILKNDNSLWTAGYGNLGCLGTGSFDGTFQFTKVMDNVAYVFCNSYGQKLFATKTDGTTWVSGYNALGSGSNSNTFVRFKMDNLMGFVENNVTLYLKSDGSLYRENWWDHNITYLSGGIQAIYSGPYAYGTYILSTSGNLYYMGTSTYGLSGLDVPDGTWLDSPTFVIGGVKTYSSGGGSSCAVSYDGHIYAWGAFGKTPHLMDILPGAKDAFISQGSSSYDDKVTVYFEGANKSYFAQYNSYNSCTWYETDIPAGTYTLIKDYAHANMVYTSMQGMCLLRGDGQLITCTKVQKSSDTFAIIYGQTNDWHTFYNSPTLFKGASIDYRSLDYVLKTASWRADSQRFYANLSDVNLPELSDSVKSDSILQYLSSNSVKFIGLGTDATSSSITSLITLLNGAGTFINNSNLDTAFNNMATYITTSVAKNTNVSQYILLNDPLNLTSYYSDYENDPLQQLQWKATHVDPNYFDNPLGTYGNSGVYQTSSIATLDKPGKYEITLKARDNPLNKPAFSNYWLWSNEDLAKMVVYVHRKPFALFSTSFTGKNGSNYIVSVNDMSYDLDHTSRADKGIQAWRWQWQDTANGIWNDGMIPSQLSAGGKYILKLEVQDMEGAWSDPYQDTITTTGLNFAPSVDCYQTGTNTVYLYRDTDSADVDLTIKATDIDKNLDHLNYAITNTPDTPTSWTTINSVPAGSDISVRKVLNSDGTYYVHMDAYDSLGLHTYVRRGPFKILKIFLSDFRITNITDRKFKGYTFYPVYVPDMAFDQSNYSSLLKKGYAFYFEISSVGLSSTDTIRIRPRFFDSVTQNELDMYYINENNHYTLATSAYGSRDPNDIVKIYYEKDMTNLLGYHNEINLPYSLAVNAGDHMVWKGRYGIPITAIFVLKGNIPSVQSNRITNPVIVNFDIEAIKNGVPSYNYISRGEWEKECRNGSGLPLNPSKHSKYTVGDVILINPKKDATDDFDSVPTW